jgi:hypothetical protein
MAYAGRPAINKPANITYKVIQAKSHRYLDTKLVPIMVCSFRCQLNLLVVCYLARQFLSPEQDSVEFSNSSSVHCDL